MPAEREVFWLATCVEACVVPLMMCCCARRLWLNALLGLICFLAFCILQRSVFPEHYRFRLVSTRCWQLQVVGYRKVALEQPVPAGHSNMAWVDVVGVDLLTHMPGVQVAPSTTVKPRPLATRGLRSLWYVQSRPTQPSSLLQLMDSCSSCHSMSSSTWHVVTLYTDSLAGRCEG